MKRFEVEPSQENWIVIDRTTGASVSGLSATLSTRLEAQALADYRNALATPIPERVSSRVQLLRLAWKAVVGRAR